MLFPSIRTLLSTFLVIASFKYAHPTTKQAANVLTGERQAKTPSHHRSLPTQQILEEETPGFRLLPEPDLKLLTSNQVRFFLKHGYLHLKTKLSNSFNAALFKQFRHIHRDEFNPGNNIVPRVDKIQAILKDNHVRGALTSLLGPGYVLHPHRHVHEAFPGKQEQPLHQDTYFDYFQRHHHVPQWVMIFYYPQDTTIELGPTNIVNGSQYDDIDRPRNNLRMPLLVNAGDFVLVHYNIWHGGGANTLGPAIPGTQWRNSKDLLFMKRANAFPSDPKVYRYMLKLQFIRFEQPGVSGPTWDWKENSALRHESQDSIDDKAAVIISECDEPCRANDEDGLGDGICDEAANLCRCDWDGGDCISLLDNHKDAKHIELHGRNLLPRNGENEKCSVEKLLDGGALQGHLWRWMTGGKRSIATRNERNTVDSTLCEDIIDISQVLSTNLPIMQRSLSNPKMQFMRRLNSAYTMGYLGRRIRLHNNTLYAAALRTLMNAFYTTDATVDERDSAALDASMYGLTAFGPEILASVSVRLAIGRATYETVGTNTEIAPAAVRNARNLGRSAFIIGNLLNSGELCGGDMTADSASEPCYFYPALIAVQQLCKAATSVAVPAIQRRDAIEALGISLRRLINDATMLSNADADLSDFNNHAHEKGRSKGGNNTVSRSHNALVEVTPKIGSHMELIPDDEFIVAEKNVSFKLNLNPTRLFLALADSQGQTVTASVRNAMIFEDENLDPAAPLSSDDWTTAETIEVKLHQRLTKKEFSQGVLDLAAKVVVDLMGIIVKDANYLDDINYKGERGTRAGKLRFVSTQCRFMALYTLGQIGKYAAPAVPVVAQIAGDTSQDRYIRGYALETLRQIGTIDALRALADVAIFERWDPQTNLYTTF